MQEVLTYACASLVVVVLLGVLPQRAAVIGFVRFLRRTPVRSLQTPHLPKAAILFPIRGADPQLKECLQALSAQDYADYRIVIVADDRHDPGIQLVEELRREAGADRFQIRVLSQPLKTCSLKNSCLVEAVASLDDSFGIVAFIDGDIVPHSRWLSDLCAPLGDPTVGATTGNRWYLPPAPASYGSLVRRVWNVGAVVQMWLTGIVWGGSMAMRIDVLRGTGLCDVWRRSMSTDSVVTKAIRKHGYRVAFVPDAVMPVREEVSLDSFRVWMVRQLMMVLLYHSGWKLMFLQALSIISIYFGSAVLMAYAATMGAWTHFAVVLSTLLLYCGAGVFDVRQIEGAMNERRFRAGDEPFAQRPLTERMRTPAAVVTAMFVFVVSLTEACFRRQIRWRGITYEIRGARNIVMTGFRPFESKPMVRDLRSVM